MSVRCRPLVRALALLFAAAPCVAQSAPTPSAKPPAPPYTPRAPWTTEQEIAAAVQPLPAALRAGATVYGWRAKGELTLLRQGTNEMICLGDDPTRKNFHVACYHRDLEPFMARGRELTAKGFDRSAVDSARLDDIEKKKWAMPAKPTALYELFGPEGSYDPATNTLNGAKPLYVVYMPYATPAQTGFATDGAKNGLPWMMYPGEPWAHIMISP